MAHRLLLAAMLLATAIGCAQEQEPVEPAQVALRQLRSGQFNDAIATASDLLRKEPQNAEAYYYRGRAYQLRNAIGDRQRAIADFTEAIRLNPDESDPYYSRSLVYRDLGQEDLANADDEAARERDGLLKETLDRMPSLTSPQPIAKAPDEVIETDSPDGKKTAGMVPKGEDDQKKLYEDLKSRFEPGFGELRTPGTSSAADKLQESKAATAERYRKMFRRDNAATEGAGRRDSEDRPVQDQFAQPAPAFVREADVSGTTASAKPMGSARPGVNIPMRAPLTSPFAPPSIPSSTAQVPPGMQTPPGVHSPFPQRSAGATGFVQPVNPFGAQGTTRTPVTRSFTPAPSSGRFSNPAVRPDNPRDFLP